jgi:hypothetical protein
MSTVYSGDVNRADGWRLPLPHDFGGNLGSEAAEPYMVLVQTAVWIGIILLAILVAGLLIACVLSPKDGLPVDRK